MDGRKLRLSEALRLGSMLRPQVKYVRHSSEGTCALGAIDDAVGGSWWAEAVFPELRSVGVHPLTGVRGALNTIVADLNNGTSMWFGGRREAWSREKIADWLETLEREGTAGGGGAENAAEKEETAVCA
jgi:hypothetical protein